MKKILCWFKGHRWESKPEEGNWPPQAHIASLSKHGDYARVCCTRCGITNRMTKHELKKKVS